MTDVAREVARQLLTIGAVELNPRNPFIWTSGIRSPIYCDNRLTLAVPAVRRYIAGAFARLIRSEYPDATVIAGTATAGIPHAAWVADLLDLPMAYIRASAKKHGKQNWIEGKNVRNENVIVIEDMISTGGSSLQAAEAVRNEGGLVLAVVAIVTYGFSESERRFAEAGISLRTLTDYRTILDEGIALGVIRREDLQTLSEWQKNPRTWA
jgi:orotate phosphoribosyltransferase